MPRLAALMLLAGVAVSALPRRRPAAAPSPEPVVRPLTPDECRLLFMSSLSKALH